MGSVDSDSGLDCLTLMLRFHQVAVNPDQIRHQFSGGPIGVTEMLRCAQGLNLRARATSVTWDGLGKFPLPVIAALTDGKFLIVGKVSADGVLVQIPSSSRPEILKRAEFEERWTGL